MKKPARRHTQSRERDWLEPNGRPEKSSDWATQSKLGREREKCARAIFLRWPLLHFISPSRVCASQHLRGGFGVGVGVGAELSQVELEQERTFCHERFCHTKRKARRTNRGRPASAKDELRERGEEG